MHMPKRPANILARLPSWINRWFGYRASPPPKRPDYLVWFWSFVGAFGGIAAIMALFGQLRYFIDRGVPSIIASYVCIIPLAFLQGADVED